MKLPSMFGSTFLTAIGSPPEIPCWFGSVLSVAVPCSSDRPVTGMSGGTLLTAPWPNGGARRIQFPVESVPEL